MNIPPELIAAGGFVVTVLAAMAYSHFTGNEASVDTDGDGEDELTFGGDDDEVVFEGEAEGMEEDTTVTPPEYVEDIGIDLEDITGVGETRAVELTSAGFETASDIYYASDENLEDVDGIGEYTVEQIRSDIGSVEDE